jgi:hypothetical protein
MARFTVHVARTLCALLCLLALAGPAVAQEPALDRGWAATQIDPGKQIYDAWSAPSGLGDTLVMYVIPGPTEVAAIVHQGVLGDSRELGSPGYWNMTGVDGSPLFGAVAAWAGGGLHIAQVAAGASAIEMVATDLAGTPGDYSYGRPIVRFGPAGDVAVVYLASTEDGQQIMARIRPAGGEWAASEAVTPPSPGDSVIARDVAIANDGTVVVGVSVAGRARVAMRRPGEAFVLGEPLGEPLPEHSWNVPRVGVDGGGTVVAAWLEGAPINDTGPVKIAFRPPGADAFGTPQDSGMRATDSGHIALGVSMPGEVVLLVEASTSNPNGGTHLEGLQAAMGLTHLQRLGKPGLLTGIWGSYPWFDMNARGDAVVVWDECCPMALHSRRRLPLGGFGPVVDVQPPIEFEGSRNGRWSLGAHLDDLGTAHATWLDSARNPAAYFVGADGPLLDAGLPEVGDVGETIAPVLDGVALDDPLPEPPRPEIPEPPAGVPQPPVPAVAPLIPAAVPKAVAAAADRVAPRLSVRSRGIAARALRVSLACDELCGARLRVLAGRRGGRYIDAMVRPGARIRIALPLPPRARGKRFRVEGVVADASGNLVRVNRRVAP